jgi:hypothetical protein
MLTEVFYSFLITSLIGCVLALAKMAYKSKCKRCSICGISVEHSVELEEKIDELEIQKAQKAKNDEENNKEIHGV